MNDIEIALEDLDTMVEIARQNMINTGAWLGLTESALLIKETLEEKLNGGWITVSKRLPEISDEKINEGYSKKQVIVFTNTEPKQKMAWFDIEDEKFYDDFSFFGVPLLDVAAWKLISEEYKEEF